MILIFLLYLTEVKWPEHLQLSTFKFFKLSTYFGLKPRNGGQTSDPGLKPRAKIKNFQFQLFDFY